MKKSYAMPVLAILFAAILSISSCKKDDLVVPYNLGDQQICLQADAGTEHYQIFEINITQSQITSVLSAAGVNDLSRIKKASLRSGLKVSIAATSSGNLNEIGNVEVYVKETGSQDAPTQIAYSQPISDNATEAMLAINGIDIKNLMGKNITLVVKVLNKTALTAKCLTLGNGIIDISVRQ